MTANEDELNQVYEDPIKGKTVLINVCSREGLTEFPEMKPHFDLLYPAYAPNPEVISQMGELSDGFKVTVVLGTWCGDSKLHVPRFFKIADQLGIEAQNIKLIGVDGAKRAGHGLLDGMGIEQVPTFVFYEGGTELGRIVESPQTTLENDLLSLLKK